MRDGNKYERLIELGRALPFIRQKSQMDLARPGLNRIKILATVVRLLELTLIRIGNEEYAKHRDSFGLSKRYSSTNSCHLELMSIPGLLTASWRSNTGTLLDDRKEQFTDLRCRARIGFDFLLQ